MAGYSDTPLIKKLGIKEGHRLALVNAPDGFEQQLGHFPKDAVQLSATAKRLDFILFFTTSEKSLRANFKKLASRLQPNGMIWISWPKKSAGVPTDLAFNNVQRIGLDAGLVDVKICAVDDTWSGLKFVYRIQDRPKS
jgi:hypothetical protein